MTSNKVFEQEVGLEMAAPEMAQFTLAGGMPDFGYESDVAVAPLVMRENEEAARKELLRLSNAALAAIDDDARDELGTDYLSSQEAMRDKEGSNYLMGADFAKLMTGGDVYAAAEHLIADLPEEEREIARGRLNACGRESDGCRLVGELWRNKVRGQYAEQQQKLHAADVILQKKMDSYVSGAAMATGEDDAEDAMSAAELAQLSEVMDKKALADARAVREWMETYVRPLDGAKDAEYMMRNIDGLEDELYELIGEDEARAGMAYQALMHWAEQVQKSGKVGVRDEFVVAVGKKLSNWGRAHLAMPMISMAPVGSPDAAVSMTPEQVAAFNEVRADYDRKTNSRAMLRAAINKSMVAGEDTGFWVKSARNAARMAGDSLLYFLPGGYGMVAGSLDTVLRGATEGYDEMRLNGLSGSEAAGQTLIDTGIQTAVELMPWGRIGGRGLSGFLRKAAGKSAAKPGAFTRWLVKHTQQSTVRALVAEGVSNVVDEAILEPIAGGLMTYGAERTFDLLGVPHGPSRGWAESFDELAQIWGDPSQLAGLVMFSAGIGGATAPRIRENVKWFARTRTMWESQGLPTEQVDDVMASEDPLAEGTRLVNEGWKSDSAGMRKRIVENNRAIKERGEVLVLTGVGAMDAALANDELAPVYAGVWRAYAERGVLPYVEAEADGKVHITKKDRFGKGNDVDLVLSMEDADAYLIHEFEEVEKRWLKERQLTEGASAERPNLRGFLMQNVSEVAGGAMLREAAEKKAVRVEDVTRYLPEELGALVKKQGGINRVLAERISEWARGMIDGLMADGASESEARRSRDYAEGAVMSLGDMESFARNFALRGEIGQLTGDVQTSLFRYRGGMERVIDGKKILGSTLFGVPGRATAFNAVEDVAESMLDEVVQARALVLAGDGQMSYAEAEGRAWSEMAGQVARAREAVLKADPKMVIPVPDGAKPMSVIEAFSAMAMSKFILSSATPGWMKPMVEAMKANLTAAAAVDAMGRAWTAAAESDPDSLGALADVLDKVGVRVADALSETRLEQADVAAWTVASGIVMSHVNGPDGAGGMPVSKVVADADEEEQAILKHEAPLAEETVEEVKQESARAAEQAERLMEMQAAQGANAPAEMRGVFDGDNCAYNATGGYWFGMIQKSKLVKSTEQVKVGTKGKHGVIAGRELTGNFQASAAPLYVWMRTNGELWLISGRHRYELMMRDNGVESHPCYVFREDAEHDEKWARMMDYENNMRDDQADELTAGTYVRETGLSDAELEVRGLMRNESRSKRGALIGRHAREELWTRFSNGKIKAKDAEVICNLTRYIKDQSRVDEIQRRCCMLLDNGKSWDYIGGMVQLMVQAELEQGQQGWFNFGADFEAALERAATWIEKALKAVNENIELAKRGRDMSGKKADKAARLGIVTSAGEDVQQTLQDLQVLKGKLELIGSYPELRQQAEMWDGESEVDPVGWMLQQQALENERMAAEKELEAEEYLKQQQAEATGELFSMSMSAESNMSFSVRTSPAPKMTGIGYKVFFLKNGKLYPPMVANPGGEDTPIGVWLDADEGVRAADSKTGRPQVKAGGKGTQGGSGTLAYRPGWHLGKIPYALQFNRKNPVTGERDLFPADFVWAEVEYAADQNYQEEAMSYGVNKNGKFQHSLAGLPRIPADGYYEYRTNPDPRTDPWIITGAMKVNRVLSKSEVDELVRAAGREPQKVQEASFSMSMSEEMRAIKEAAEKDGTFMKAPNGKQSNLNERQWLQVRTAAFKRWFGDWERAADLTIESGQMSYKDAKDKLEQESSLMRNDDTGIAVPINTTQRDKMTSPQARRKSIANGFTVQQHNAVVSKIRGVFKHAMKIGDYNDKNADANIDSIKRFAAPVMIDGGKALAFLTVKCSYQKKKLRGEKPTKEVVSRLYSVELDEIVKLDGQLKRLEYLQQNASASSSEEIIAKFNAKVKEYFDNVSKVVDTNGEPLVVYHGSLQWFHVFNDGNERHQSGAPDGTIFANDNREIAVSFVDYYGGKAEDVILDANDARHARMPWGVYRKGGIYPLFMNLMNPLVVDFEGMTWHGEKYDIKDVNWYADEARKKGHDGLIIRNVIDVGFTDTNDVPPSTDYVAFESNQIKSATDNRGAFDGREADISMSMERNLAAVHTLSPEKFLSALELGGMPMPSVAVTRLDKPYGWGGAGNIMLVGRPALVDPKEGTEVYSADAWTGKFPRVIHKHQENADFKEAAKAAGEMEDKYGYVFYQLADKLRQADTRSDLQYLLETDNGKALFAYMHGYEPKAKTMARQMDYQFLDKQFAKDTRNMWENGEAIKEGQELAFADAVEASLNRWLEGQDEKYRKLYGKLYEDLLSDLRSGRPYGVWFRLKMSLNNMGQRELDAHGNREMLAKYADKHKKAFAAWVNEKVDKWRSKDGYIRETGKVATLDNVLSFMLSKKGLNNEDFMGFSPGKLRAALSDKMRSLDDIKGRRERLSDSDTSKESKKQSEELMKEYTRMVRGHLAEAGADSFYAIDYGLESLSLVKGKPTVEKVQRAVRKVFSYTKAAEAMAKDNELLQAGVDAVTSVRAEIEDYMEAVPQRAVRMNEWEYAVMPESLKKNKAVMAGLRENGIRPRFHDGTEDGRKAALSGLVNDAKVSFSMQRVTQRSLELLGSRSEEEVAQQIMDDMRKACERLSLLMADDGTDVRRGNGLRVYAEMQALLSAVRQALPEKYLKQGNLEMLLRWASVYAKMATDGEVPARGLIKGDVFDSFVAVLEKQQKQGQLQGMSAEESREALMELAGEKLEVAFMKVARDCVRRIDQFLKDRALERIEWVYQHAYPTREEGRAWGRGKMDSENYRVVDAAWQLVQGSLNKRKEAEEEMRLVRRQMVKARELLKGNEIEEGEGKRRLKKLQEQLGQLELAAMQAAAEQQAQLIKSISEELESLDSDATDFSDKEAAANERMALQQTFGNWYYKDAQEARRAARVFEDMVLRGKKKWEEKLKVEREEIAYWREQILSGFEVGREKATNTRMKQRNAVRTRLDKQLVGMGKGLMNFGHLMMALRPLLGKRFCDMKREQIARMHTNTMAFNTELKGWMFRTLRDITGLQTETEQELWLADQNQAKDTGIVITERATVKAVLTYAEAKLWLGMSVAERETERARMNAEAAAAKRKPSNVPTEEMMEELGQLVSEYERDNHGVEPQNKKFVVQAVEEWQTELHTTKDAILFGILTFEQPDYERLMEPNGITPEILDQMRRYVGPKMLRWGYAMREKLSEHGVNVARVFEEYTGIPFDARENYFKGVFDQGALKEQTLEQAVAAASGASGTGSKYGSLIPRRYHMSRINWDTSAAGVFVTSMQQQNNYVQTSKMVRGWRALLTDKAFAARFEAEIGTAAKQQIIGWLELIEGAVVADVKMAELSNRMMRRLMGGYAKASLGGNIRTLIKQVSALLNGYAGGYVPDQWMLNNELCQEMTYRKIGFGEYMMALARVLGSKGSVSKEEAGKQSFIYARKAVEGDGLLRVTHLAANQKLPGQTGPEGWLGLSEVPQGAIAWLGQKAEKVVEKAMDAIAVVDAEMCTASAMAIADVAYRQAVAADTQNVVPDEVKRAEALRLAGMALDVAGQPQLRTQKSYWAASGALGGMGDFLFMFRSDTLSKAGLWIAQMSSGERKTAVGGFLAFGVMNSLVLAMLEGLRGNLGDEDDEWYQLAGAFALNVLTNDATALPVVGDMLAKVRAGIMGEPVFQNGLSDMVPFGEVFEYSKREVKNIRKGASWDRHWNATAGLLRALGSSCAVCQDSTIGPLANLSSLTMAAAVFANATKFVQGLIKLGEEVSE